MFNCYWTLNLTFFRSPSLVTVCNDYFRPPPLPPLPSYCCVTNFRFPWQIQTLYLFSKDHKISPENYLLYRWYSSIVTLSSEGSWAALLFWLNHTRNKEKSKNKTKVIVIYTGVFKLRQIPKIKIVISSSREKFIFI